MRFAAYGRMAVYRSKHTFSNAGLPPAGRKHVVLSYHKQPGRAAHGNAARIENHTFQRASLPAGRYMRICAAMCGMAKSLSASRYLMKRRPTRPASALPSRRTTLPALICSRPVQSSRAMRCGCTVPGNRRTCRCAGWKCRPCGIWPAVTSRAFTGAPKGVLPAQAFRTAFGRVPRVGGIARERLFV